MAKRPETDARSTVSLKRKADTTAERYVLIVRNGESFELVPVTTREVVIGREQKCAVAIDDESISRQHAKLQFGATITVEDLGSRNGTFVGGRRLVAHEPRPVTIGEPITVAESSVFVERAPPKSAGTASAPRDGVIVRDAKMKQLYAVLDVVAMSPLRIVILGETGVGKEVFARTIHEKSPRRTKPYLALNCSALAESTLEGELFGYEKGAFTGATQAKPGLFESADGGTVFLDEIGELPADIQVKLLRVLESGEVMRLGALTPTRVDVRIVSATNRDLRGLVADGRFRSDLYFRLGGTTMTLPPLRERVDDIEPLARTFAAAMATRLGRSEPKLEAAALAALVAYAWPGNVRELKNVIDRAVVLRGGGAIRVEDLVLEGDFEAAPVRPSRPSRPAAVGGQGLWSEVEAMERQRIVDALAASGGNQSAAAKQLGIARATLIKRIEQYGLARPKKRSI